MFIFLLVDQINFFNGIVRWFPAQIQYNDPNYGQEYTKKFIMEETDEKVQSDYFFNDCICIIFSGMRKE